MPIYRSLRDVPANLRSLIERHDAVTGPGDPCFLKESARRKVTVQQAEEGQGKKVVVKEFRYPLGQRARKLLWKHRAMQAWSGAEILLKHGFRVPEPIALVEERRWGLVSRAYLIYRFVAGEPLDRFIERNFSGSTTHDYQARRRLLAELAGELSRQHALGIFNRDMKAENIVVRQEEGRTKFFYIDLEGVSMPPFFPEEFCLRNLAQLNASLDRPLSLIDRMFFLNTYLSSRPALQAKKRAIVTKVMRMTIRRRHRWPRDQAAAPISRPRRSRRRRS